MKGKHADNIWGNGCDSHYRLVDTPGMADSAGRDIAFLREMIATFKSKLGTVEVFVFYLSEVRLDDTTKQVIKLMEKAFGFEVWQNFVFLVKIPNSKKELNLLDIEDREAYIRERKVAIEEEYKVKNLKFIGLDIYKDFKYFCEDEEKIKIKLPGPKNGTNGATDQLTELFVFTDFMDPFDCSNINGEIPDRLTDEQIQEQRKQFMEEKEAEVAKRLTEQEQKMN